MSRALLRQLAATALLAVTVLACAGDETDPGAPASTTLAAETGDPISPDEVDFTAPDGWTQSHYDSPGGRVYLMEPPAEERGPDEFPTQITVVLAVERVDDASEYFDTMMDLSQTTLTDRFSVEVPGAESAERVSISSSFDGIDFLGEYLVIVSNQQQPIEVLCFGAIDVLDGRTCERIFDSFRLRT